LIELVLSPPVRVDHEDLAAVLLGSAVEIHGQRIAERRHPVRPPAPDPLDQPGDVVLA